MINERKANPMLKLVETKQLTLKEKDTLLNEYKLSNEVLEYVTDRYEQSNYIHDSIDEQELFVIHIPQKLEETNRYVTRPVSFVIKDNTLFSFNEDKVEILSAELNQSILEENNYTPTLFLFEELYYLIESYVPVMKEITRQRHRLDDMLTKRLTNRELVKLSHLQQTLTFVLSAAESNVDALNLIARTKFGMQLSEEEHERLEDVLIEAEQIAHMTELEAKIVDKIAKIFDSIMNNNLNDTMKFLTVWSLAIAIPTLITGFFGMNINLPQVDKQHGWIDLIIISVILIIWLIVGLKRNRKV